MITAAQAQQIADTAARIRENVQLAIVGKDEVIEYTLAALFSAGHILVEDVPGIGKTTLARSLAYSLDCEFRRIQFTPDLMPSDITGIHYYNQHNGEFEFPARPRDLPGGTGRRDQPRHAPDPIRAAGSHGRTAGYR